MNRTNRVSAVVIMVILLRLRFVYASPCDTYTELVNQERHIKYKASWDEPLKCDDHLGSSEWYRFMGPSGDRLADNTRLPKPFECGTAAPLYLATRHPSASIACDSRAPGNPYELCASYGISDCDVKFPVDIYHCCKAGKSFFIYQLKKPITGCPLSLCGTGEIQALCSYGLIPNGSNCIPAFPPLYPPKITGPHIEGNDFHFYCEIKPAVNETNDANYKVEFLFDRGHPTNAISHADSTNNFRAMLNQSDLKGKLGKSISCRARGFWTGKPVGGAYIHSSNSYWAGIQVHQRKDDGSTERVWKIQLDEANIKPFKIELHSTLPILNGSHEYFPYLLRGRPLQVQVSLKTRITDFSISRNGNSRGTNDFDCSLLLTKDDWGTATHNKAISNKTINVVPVIDGKFEPKKNAKKRYLSLRVRRYAFKSIWNNYRIADVPVYVRDHIRKECISMGDPHITTFDKKVIHLFQVGQYIMAKLVKPYVHFEVRAMTTPCNQPKVVTCNCGVAAREDNDIFIVDMCNSRHIPRVRYRTAGCGEVCPLPGNRIRRTVNGKQFSILFNSGAEVEATISGTYMTIYIRVPTYFMSQGMTGLCGNYDEKKDNDAPGHNNNYNSVFLEMNRINASEDSFFNERHVLKPVNESDVDPESHVETQRRFCHCQETKGSKDIICDASRQIKDPENVKGYSDITEKILAENTKKKRRKRSSLDYVYTDDILEDFETNFDLSVRIPETSFVDLTSFMPNVSAENYCYEELKNSSIFDTCLALDGFNINSTLSGCVTDVQITGDRQFALNARQTMEDLCIDAANKIAPAPTPEEMKDPFAQTTHLPLATSKPSITTTITDKPIKSIAERLASEACPMSCSGTGDCISGTCACYHGYTSVDCSIPVNKAPEILEISSSGLCDVDIRPCLKTHVFAKPIYGSPNLTCRVEKLKVDLKTGARNSVPFETGWTHAELISFAELICHLPREPIIPPTKDIAPVGNPVQGLRLSVSNDGIKFSEEVPLTIYDSVCIDCSKTNSKNISEEPVCVRKPGSCLINGYCHADGDPNPARPECQFCDVKTSADHFTNVTVSSQCDKCLGNPCFCDGKGWQCQCGTGYTFDNKTLGCVDIDECQAPTQVSCYPYGDCHNINGSYTCTHRECPLGFEKIGTKCLYVSSDTASFDESNVKCHALGKSFGHLAILEKKSEFKMVTKKMIPIFDYWIGISDETNNGVLQYVDGRPMPAGAYSEWVPLPTVNRTRHCALVSGQKAYMWLMRDCNETLHFVCEAPAKTSKPLIG